MNGCQWQKKNFSVAVNNKYEFNCYECKRPIDGSYKYNGDYICKKCFSKKGRKIIQLENFNTLKDLSYNFTTDMFNGKPIQIHSKKQYKNLLKQYGITDASIKECKQEAEFRKKLNMEDNLRNRRELAEKTFAKNPELLRFKIR